MGNSILYILKNAQDFRDIQEENVQALINIDTMNSISDKPTFYWDYQKKEYCIMVRIGDQVHT